MVNMSCEGSDIWVKSKQINARSEEEAIEKTINDPWWYETGEGKYFRELKYPLTFKARLANG